MSIPVIDCHYHLSLTRTFSRLVNIQDVQETISACHLQNICIQNIVLWFPKNLTRNPLSLLAKLRNPQKVFSFGGIRFPPPDALDKHFDYCDQVKQLMDLGFDGIKLFGKPNIRQRFGERFDSEIFDEMYAYLEEEQIPVLFHIGDPREFWSEESAPPFARDNGWIYTEPSFDAYYEEIEGMLTKYPRLRILFPHFFFLSDDLPRLRNFLNRWPNVWIDITPGSEMYHNFSTNPENAKNFFLEFQDRILFGTDNVGNAKDSAGNCILDSSFRVQSMVRFLDTESSSGWGETFTGLSLDSSVSNKIKCENFYRYAKSSIPKEVDVQKALTYTMQIQAIAAQANIDELDEEILKIMAAFKLIQA